jgi:hypothetical protein
MSSCRERSGAGGVFVPVGADLVNRSPSVPAGQGVGLGYYRVEESPS